MLFWLQRLVTGAGLILFVSWITFFFIYLSPQSFFDVFRSNPMISEETLALLEAHYHLEQPFWNQYLGWLSNYIRGDWGMSVTYGVPVRELILKRLPATLFLTFFGFVIGWGAGLPLGILSGRRPSLWISRILHGLTRLLFSTPVFFLTFIFLFILANMNLEGGWQSILLQGVALLTFSLYSFAFIFRISEGETRRISRLDFLWLLKVRGLSNSQILKKHILRHLLVKLLPLLGLELPALVGGSLIVEILTGWPGMGTLMLHAVRSEDLFLILGNVTLVTCLIVIGNLLADWGETLLVPQSALRQEEARAQ